LTNRQYLPLASGDICHQEKHDEVCWQAWFKQSAQLDVEEAHGSSWHDGCIVGDPNRGELRMTVGLFESTTVPVLEQVVNFAEKRHSMLAANLANLDTPGYQVHDLSPEVFESKLKGAIAERDQGHVSLSQNDVTSQVNNPFDTMTGELEDFLYHDQSTGNLESQVAAISKNQLQHNLAISILTSQFRLLQAAVSEKA
jgi:flagellar basal-body rod protein FlgB